MLLKKQQLEPDIEQDWFKTGRGVRQGYILPSCLFNLYTEYIMQNAGLDKAQARIKIARRKINNLRYVAGGGGFVTKSSLTLGTLWTDCSLPGSSVHGILQQEYLNGLPFPLSEDLPDSGIELRSPALQSDSLPTEL